MPLYKLPEKGLGYDVVMEQLDELEAAMTPDQSGKLSSTSFKGIPDVRKITHDAYNKFFSFNGLFTFQEASAAKIESDLIDICVGFVNGGEDGRGNLTSGGTESNFCAFHAMRQWARETKPHIKEPEIVAPYSIHSTVHKTLHFLDIRIKTVPQGANLECDVEAIRAAIGPNTIGIAGSAPNWPYGQVDPIEELGQIALERDLWLHVDACVGGYILPFFKALGEDIPDYDFRVPGVRSISADLHKYGYVPKPCSSIMWRSQDEQQYHFVPVTDWPCGLYLSQSLIGSRPFASVAAGWAVMNALGWDGYLENARQLLSLRKTITDRVARIEGLMTWKAHGPLLQIAPEGDLDIQLVVGGMEERGWGLLGVNNPPAIHLTLDIMEEESLIKFVDDLEEVAGDVRSGKMTTEGLLSYGGVGATETAPKWLLSAVEIMERRSQS